MVDFSENVTESTRATEISMPEPRVTGFSYDGILLPRLAAMNLDWQGPRNGQPKNWHLPHGININGPVPFRFGIHIYREDIDSYLVRLAWNEMQFGWPRLTRRELLDSSLSLLLGALGTNLEYLLDQPVQELQGR